jgi:hypothetical protein
MNCRNFGLVFVLYVCFLNISYGQNEYHTSEFYLKKYEEYLKSLKSISFSYQNILPNSSYHGEFKYNGKYSFCLIVDENNSDTTGYARELICTEKEFQMLQYNKPQTDMELFSYLDPSHDKNYALETNFTIPELFGYISAYPVLENAFIPTFLRNINTTVTKDSKNGTELILLSGQKDNMTIKIWLDPAQNFLMHFLEVSQSNTSKTGEMIKKAIVLDKFIDVKDVKFPTFYENSSSQVNVNDKGIFKNTISINLDNISITDNSKPKPFSFKTKIPNGTKAVLFDSQQIQYVWMDGKIEPLTDEVALRIARGDHKFMPGPAEPRFWFIALGIIMLLLGGGLKLRDMLKES